MSISYGGKKKQIGGGGGGGTLSAEKINSALKKLQKSRKILADSLAMDAYARPSYASLQKHDFIHGAAWIPKSMIRTINPILNQQLQKRSRPSTAAPSMTMPTPTNSNSTRTGGGMRPATASTYSDRSGGGSGPSNSMPTAIQMQKVEYLLNTRSSNKWVDPATMDQAVLISTPKQVEFPLERVFRTPSAGSGGQRSNSTVLIKDAPPTAYEKLDLGRRSLQECPPLQDRIFLKFLDLQCNFISRVDNLYTLRNLVFLDFYNNQLQRIQGINELNNLRALMLGRNKITKIEGISNLARLDILDLHSNRITELENMRGLVSLRVLNVEDNLVRELPTLTGLVNLVEINLRRNKVWAVHDNQHCRKLQKVVLTDNLISLIQDMEAVFNLEALSELWLDQNKVASLPMFKTMMVSKCHSLKLLNGRRVLEEAKRSALKLVRKEESKRKDLERKADYQQEKNMYLKQIKSDWLLQEAEIAGKSTNESGDSVLLSSLNMSTPSPKKAYVELDGTILRIFGNGSAAINRTESHVATQICFDYVPFSHVAIYSKAMALFPNLTRLSFANNNLTNLKQLLPLSVIVNLTTLDIDGERNSLVQSTLFRPFTVFLFPKMQLLCEIPVGIEDRKAAMLECGHLKTIGLFGSTTLEDSSSFFAYGPSDEVELFQRSRISQEVQEMIETVIERKCKQSRLLYYFDSCLYGYI